MRSWRCVILGFCLVLIAFFYTYLDTLMTIHARASVDYSKYENIPAYYRNISSPIVLLWTPYFALSGKWLPSPAALNCPVSDCIITDDRNLLPLSSAVILHLRDTSLRDLPKYRTPQQRWILYNNEAPPHTPKNIVKELSGKINWTATYRRNSDIPSYYGWISRRKIPVDVAPPPTNRKLVCWLVSNCNTPSRREAFVKELKSFISVDIYGKCGNLQCPVKGRLACYKSLSKKYKFYLSFENSICKDYVTEKLFNALSTDMVPVVMGGGNYREILPPNSYIDALSFKGPGQLAEYLRELDKDEDKYLSFLTWKRKYEVVDGGFRWACDVCRKLHLNGTKIYENLDHWWFEESKCVSGKY